MGPRPCVLPCFQEVEAGHPGTSSLTILHGWFGGAGPGRDGVSEWTWLQAPTQAWGNMGQQTFGGLLSERTLGRCRDAEARKDEGVPLGPG